MIKIYDMNEVRDQDIFLRHDAVKDVSQPVAEIIRRVRAEGDAALYHYAREFDKVELSALAVTEQELDEALAAEEPEFLDALASKAPVPGGGGASALVGAVGVALGNMVGNLTVGKKKYASVEADVIALDQKAGALRRRLAELDELERQAREAAAQAEEAAPGEGGAEITEIHGGPQEHDSEES